MAIDLKKRFTYHPPRDEEQMQRYKDIRSKGYELAACILAHTPESREQSSALTKVEEAVMWANAAIARRE